MKKRIMALVLAASMVLGAAACNKKSSDEYAQYMDLADYKNITIEVTDAAEVTDEEIEEHVQQYLQANAEQQEVTDRPVQEGDTVSIDYKGYVDGVAFEGGEGSYDLTIGSGAFIDGFEDGLIGAELGETRDVTATFPDPYKNNPDLAGKEATFTVTVNKITENILPELTDEMMQTTSDGEFDTVEAYREYIRESLTTSNDTDAARAKRTKIMTALSDATTFKSFPEDKMTEYTEYWQNYVEFLAKVNGYDLDSYLSLQNMDEDTYKDWIQQMAEESCKQYLICSAIAAKEGIEVTDEEVDAALQEDADAAGVDADTYLTTYSLSKEDYHFEVLSNKVLDYMDGIVTVSGETEAASEAETETETETTAE